MSNNKGFTLVELSIVLVIIGLIVGGVIGGSELIKQTRVKSVISDVNQIKTAINMFRDKYDALPGDFNAAASYWSATSGDGDNAIEVGGENLQAYKQLSLAGLVAGSYPGSATGNIDGFAEVMGSKLKPGMFWIHQWGGNFYGHKNNFNAIDFAGGNCASSATPSCASTITATDATSLETKMDDDDPDSGKIYVHPGYDGGADATGCVTASTNWSTSTTTQAFVYTAGTKPTCRMIFWLDF